MAAELQFGTRGELTLRVYALGCVDFDTLLRFQRRLHYEITEDRRSAAVILCEHPPTITIGRQGSRRHIQLEADELQLRGWPIHWVNRGGGSVLHLPGQLALYPILPLDRLGLSIGDYVQRLGGAIGELVGDFSVHEELRTSDEGVWVGPRLLAAIGVSVRDWVTGYGAYINVRPPLNLFRFVATVADRAMTSLERERRGPVRPSLVRERLLEHFQSRFHFGRCLFFSDHPALAGAPTRLAETAPAPLPLVPNEREDGTFPTSECPERS